MYPAPHPSIPQGELISDVTHRTVSRSDAGSDSLHKGEDPTAIDKEQQILQREVAKDEEELEHDRQRQHELYMKLRPFILGLTAAVILGWWISATILPATRHRWIVQTFFAWAFIFIIAFRFIPNRVITHPVSAVWTPLVQNPWYRLPRKVRLSIGWACLLAIVFGSAFGFKLEPGTNYGDRAISVLGLFIFQCGFYLSSINKKEIPWPTVIVGLFLQQAIALFVLKSDAGFSIFHWIAMLASDFLTQGLAGAAFFFSQDVVTNDHWFFVNTLAEIIFFIAFVQMMYYLGVMSG